MHSILKSLFHTAILIVISLPIFGQWTTIPPLYFTSAIDLPGMGKIEDMKEITSRKLIVVIQEADDKVLEKLKNKKDTEQLTQYRDAIKKVNENITTITDSLWEFHDTFITKTWSQIDEIDKEDKEKYTVIYLVRYEEYEYEQKKMYREKFDINFTSPLIGGILFTEANRSGIDNYTVLKIMQLEDYKKSPPVQIPMAHLSPTKSDLAFGMSYANWYIKMKLLEKRNDELRDILDNNSKQLKELTLLATKNDLEKMKSTYIIDKKPYPYSVLEVTEDQMNEYILSHTPGFAYLNYNCGKSCAVNCENGEPLFIPRIYDWLEWVVIEDIGKKVSKMLEK